MTELAGADERDLARTFGPNTGPWLRQLARGEDRSEVTAEAHVAKGCGRERTFQKDLGDAEEIRREVGRLARELAEELVKEGEWINPWEGRRTRCSRKAEGS